MALELAEILAGSLLKTGEAEMEQSSQMRMPDFASNEQGQDFIEFTLLLAFVVLAATAMFLQSGTSMNQIWAVTSNLVSTAASVSAS